jgi:hypothetical protein
MSPASGEFVSSPNIIPPSRHATSAAISSTSFRLDRKNLRYSAQPCGGRLDSLIVCAALQTSSPSTAASHLNGRRLHGI